MSAPFGQGGEDPLSGPVVTPANFSGDTVMLPDDNNNNTNKKPPTHSPTSMEAPETNFGGNNDATATTTAQSSAARQHEPCASMKKELIPASTNDPPIDNLKRFRFLFFGLLSLLIASAPGCFAIFGFYIQVVYEYTLEDMVDLFCIGTTVGMFCAFLMGILYDFYAQRLTISICVILIFISSLCFALIFDSRVDFQGSKTRFDILFFLMNAGGYSLKVISVVTMVTHLPRNRGMVCGVLETFFGLGASIYSCLFRGYFGSHFDDLMYFMAVFSLVVGIIVVIFFDTAPWADIRFFSRIRLMRTFKLLSSRVHITKGELQRNLNEHILKKVPYIKYSISTRRIRILFGVLMLTNFFLTGQIIGIAYGGITSRGVLCVFSTIAILLLCLLACVMLLPFKWIDGDVDFSLDEQDVDLDGEPLYRAHSPHEMEGVDANPLHGGSRSASINASMAAPSVTQMVFSADVASRMRSSNADEDESSDGDGSSGSGSYSSSTGSGSSYSSSSGSQHSATSSRTSLDQTQRLAMYERTDATGRVHHMSRANHVLAELKLLPQNKRLPINYETITEVIKYREGVFNALRTPEIWALMFMSFVVISTGIIITSNLFIQVFYASVNKGSMEMNKYYLYAAISGVAIAAGRVSLSSIGDDLMPLLRKKLHKPYQIPFTYLLIIPPWIIVLALILFLSIGPADGLLVGYVVVSFGFGLSTSIIPYSLTTFYSYEHVGVGKAYGICEACAGLGVMAFYRGMFYELYHKKAFPMDFPLPQVRGMCLTGKKDCAQTYLIISLVLNVLAGCVAIYVHLRFQKRLLAAARAQIALVRDDDCIPVGRGAAAV